MLIIGAGRAGSSLSEIIQNINPVPFTLVGFIDDDQKKQGSSICGLPVLGSSETLLDVIDKQSVTDLIFAISGDLKGTLYSAILTAEEHGIEVTTMPVVYEELLGRVPISLVADDWVLRSFVDRAHASGSYDPEKGYGFFGSVNWFDISHPLISNHLIINHH